MKKDEDVWKKNIKQKSLNPCQQLLQAGSSANNRSVRQNDQADRFAIKQIIGNVLGYIICSDFLLF